MLRILLDMRQYFFAAFFGDGTIWHLGQFDTFRTIWHRPCKEDNLTPYQITRSKRDILCTAVSRTFNREALVVPPARTASPDVYSHRLPGWRSEHCQENQWSYQIYIHSEENLCKSMSWQQRQQLNQANREAAEARHGARISVRYSHKKITTIGSKKNTI